MHRVGSELSAEEQRWDRGLSTPRAPSICLRDENETNFFFFFFQIEIENFCLGISLRKSHEIIFNFFSFLNLFSLLLRSFMTSGLVHNVTCHIMSSHAIICIIVAEVHNITCHIDTIRIFYCY